MEYIVDDSVEELPWRAVISVEHLDPDKTYLKYLTEINNTLGPKYTLSLSLDYESMKLLLKQAREYNIPFIESNELKARFIIKNENMDVARRLLVEEGYTKNKKLVSLLDPCLYKRVTQVLDNEIDIDEVTEHRKEYITGLLSSPVFPMNLTLFPEKYIFDTMYYFDIKYNNLDIFETVKLFLLDIITEYFFDDYYTNIAADMNQIIKYVELTDTTLVPYERLEYYRQFISLDMESTDKLIEYFNQFKNVNIMNEFYDDIRKLKDASYKSLVDSCTKFTKDSPLYNEELSKQHGCEIYYLDGEEFYGFVRSDAKIKKWRFDHSTGAPRVVDNPQPTKEQIGRLGPSFTYIGKDDIQTFKNPKDNLTMLYRGIDYRTIGHVYHNDSWSSSNYSNYSDCQNELHTPDSLLRESTKYPEIFITDLSGIEPFALICLDEVTDWDVEFSKRNNMPIVVINTLKYERKYSLEDFSKDQYKR